jgi:hypothetical protein
MLGVGTGNTLNPGIIAGNQNIECSTTAPALLTSVADATTGSGTLTYQWQDSTKNGSWTNISGATASTYQPGNLSDTTWFRRKASAGAFSDFSNTVAVNVQFALAGDPSVFPVNSCR